MVVRLGWTSERFWRATPAEINSYMTELAEEKESEVQLARAQAYWTAVLSRAKDIPTFDKWMSKPKKARALHGEEAELRQAEYDDFASRLSEAMKEGTQSDGTSR